jgi:D-alanyl-D-alanine carboxypeptidase (penicillin-binding protein 5/6)
MTLKRPVRVLYAVLAALPLALGGLVAPAGGGPLPAEVGAVTPASATKAPAQPAASEDFLTVAPPWVVALEGLAVYGSVEFDPSTATGEELAPGDKIKVLGLAASAAGEPRLEVEGGFISAAVAEVGLVPLYAPKAQAVYAFDLETGETLYSKSARTPTRVASLAKVLTLLIVNEEVASGNLTWKTRVSMTSRALVKMSKDPDCGGFKFKLGGVYSVKQLYDLALLESHNAAVTALGIEIAGSNSEFVKLLNARAADLGMADSSFISVSGLDNHSLRKFGLALPGTAKTAGNLISARDLGIATRQLLNTFPQVVETASLTSTKVKTKTVKNTNQMLPGGRYYSKSLAVNGLKTGYTQRSGYCLVLTSKKAGKHGVGLIIVHSPSSAARFDGVSKLLRTIYQRFPLTAATAPGPAQ